VDDDFLLETERLSLRPYRREDIDDLHAMFSDPEHMRFYPKPFNREGTRTWVERQLDGYQTRGFALWIVEDRRTGEFIGTAGPALLQVEGADEVEIGWHTKRDHWGQGIAVEAGTAARDWAFANLGVDHLISLVRPENGQSRRVAAKIGMLVDREVDYKGLRHLVYRVDRVEG